MIVSVSNPDLKLSFMKPEVLNRNSGQGVVQSKMEQLFCWRERCLVSGVVLLIRQKSKSPTLSFFLGKKTTSLFFKNFKQSTECFKMRCFDDQIQVAFITLAKFIKTAISLTKNNCASLKPFCDFAKVKAGCFVFSYSKNNQFLCQ